MGPIWGRQDPGGPHVGPMNFAILAIVVNHFRPHLSVHFAFVAQTFLVMTLSKFGCEKPKF